MESPAHSEEGMSESPPPLAHEDPEAAAAAEVQEPVAAGPVDQDPEAGVAAGPVTEVVANAVQAAGAAAITAKIRSASVYAGLVHASQTGLLALNLEAVAIRDALEGVLEAASAVATITQCPDAGAAVAAAEAAKDALLHFVVVTELLINTNTLPSHAVAAVQLEMGE